MKQQLGKFKYLTNITQNTVLLEILLVLTFTILFGYLRFIGLGETHFYGDEIKTFYLDKTTPAYEFFMDQRKGPVQFFIVWITENIVGGFDEFYTRLPFVVIGVLNILLFYLISRKLFGINTAVLSTLLFGLNGFNIAFSRTVQYQSPLLMFGLISLYFSILYSNTKKINFLVFSAISFGISLLCHYDGVFFVVPLVYFIFKDSSIKKSIKPFGIFLLISLMIISIFYLPYIFQGYFQNNTLHYVLRRVEGKEVLPGNSLKTIFVYNPSIIYLFLLVSGVIYGMISRLSYIKILFIWFFIPFVIFEFFIANPGTHIMNYLTPAYLLSGILLNEISQSFRLNKIIYIYYIFLVFSFTLTFIYQVYSFDSRFNSNYPWSGFKNKYVTLNKPVKNFQLFLYGFPYDRGWDQISEYISDMGRIHNIYTNDNDNIAEYYLVNVKIKKPGTNYLPLIYIHVLNSFEIDDGYENSFYKKHIYRYQKIKEIFVDNEKTAEIYKLEKDVIPLEDISY